MLAYRMYDALYAVGMEGVSLDTEVWMLSGGYK